MFNDWYFIFRKKNRNFVFIFFFEDKMLVVGYDEDIVCFRDGILIFVLYDEVIIDLMNLDEE